MPTIRPNSSLLDNAREVPELRTRDVIACMGHQVAAIAALRCQSLLAIVTGLRKKKQALGRFGRSDPHRTAQIALAFKTTELVIPSTNRCLRRSLGFVHAVLSAGCEAEFFIGVHMNPFGAHAWVQQSDIVLNDFLDIVRKFQPILIV